MLSLGNEEAQNYELKETEGLRAINRVYIEVGDFIYV